MEANVKKHIYLIMVFCLGLGKESNALNSRDILILVKTMTLTINQDTTKFLKDNIISRKETFLHKNLNTLLKELHLEVKSYSNVHNSNPPAGSSVPLEPQPRSASR
ncbi:hypothetical protein SAMN05216524_1011145 [Mucilaginibacter sp. OK098]|nr:hypothetical protein SAMN05216524_1011145 [Mucilaginibacter sp. OK098]